jgi:O-antigen/teichoic acid export membrane protein
VLPVIRLFGARGTRRALAVRGSALEIVGFALSQVLRMGSNIILSRLLFPRAFGLSALVSIFNVGLTMLSDVGIGPSVIRSHRGDDLVFLNTAWTIQVVRGFLLYAIAIVAAWPLAVLYNEPQLFWLTIVGSSSVAISGLHSTSLYTLRRRLSVGTTLKIELGSQVAALVVTISWAYARPSVWSLVGGSIVSALVTMASSHAVDVGYKNGFAWDKGSRAEISSFGKWIFGSSAATFVSKQGDRLYLGRVLGAGELGVYSIGLFLSEATSMLVMRLTAGILFPLLGNVRGEGTQRLREVYYKARLGLDALALPALGALTMLGPWVVRLIYDQRYHEAGWILQVLSIRVAMSCLIIPCETCLVVYGQPRWGFFQNVVRMAWLVVALPIGWHLAQFQGIVWAALLSEVPIFFVLWPPSWRAGLLRLELELRGVLLYLLGLGAGWLLARIL